MRLRRLAAVIACSSNKTGITAFNYFDRCNLAGGLILAMHPPACSDEAMELLRRGWAPGEEPKYDTNHALVLCRMHNFCPGLIFLYEHMRLFREVMQVGFHAGGEGVRQGTCCLIRLCCMHNVRPGPSSCAST